MNSLMGDFGRLPAELRQQIFTYVLSEVEFEVLVNEEETNFDLRSSKPTSFASLQICRALRHENSNLQQTIPTLVFMDPLHLRKYVFGELRPISRVETNDQPQYRRLRSIRLLFLKPLQGHACFDQTNKTRENRDDDYQGQTEQFALLRDRWHRAFKTIPSSVRYIQFDYSSKPSFNIFDLNMVGRFISLLSTLAYLRSERRARSSVVGCRQDFEHKILEAFIPGRASISASDRQIPLLGM